MNAAWIYSTATVICRPASGHHFQLERQDAQEQKQKQKDCIFSEHFNKSSPHPIWAIK